MKELIYNEVKFVQRLNNIAEVFQEANLNNGIVGDINNYFKEKLNIDNVLNSDKVQGELFILKDDNVLIYFYDKELNLLKLLFFGDSNFAEDYYNFRDNLYLQLRNIDDKLEIFYDITDVKDRVLDILKDMSLDIKEDENESKAVNLLKKIRYRLILESINEGKYKETEDDKPVVEELEAYKLISKDYLVVCKETGKKILKVPTLEAIQESVKRGMKCFHCGKSLADEEINELLDTTHLGKKMLKNNYWLTIMLHDLIKELTIENNPIFVINQQDVVFAVFEKDGGFNLFVGLNRDLSIQDAHIIASYIDMFYLNNIIVVSTDELNPLYKSYLVKLIENKVNIHFLLIKDNLKEEILTIYQNIHVSKIKELLSLFEKSISINISDIIEYRLFKELNTNSDSEKKEDKKENKKKKVKAKAK